MPVYTQLLVENMYPPPDFVGIMIEGPSSEGYYFRAYYMTAGGSLNYSGTLSPPIMPDGTMHTWSLTYDPLAASDAGSITVMLDAQSVVLDLGPGDKQEGAVLDRFGIFAVRCGGHAVKVYVDDLTYTCR